MSESDRFKLLIKSFTANGYEIDKNVNVGDITFSYVASRKLFYYLLPYHQLFYIFESNANNKLPMSNIMAINEMARFYTENIFSLNIFLRYITPHFLPITTTLIFSEKGFETNAIEYVLTNKTSGQMRNCNNVVLINDIDEELFYLKHVGFVAALPLYRANKESLIYLRSLFQEDEKVLPPSDNNSSESAISGTITNWNKGVSNFPTREEFGRLIGSKYQNARAHHF